LTGNRGDGIYMHDTSDAVIAHNLCFGNPRYGITIRLATNRILNGRPAECSRNTILNNVVFGNGTAPLRIPAEQPGQTANRSDYNLLLPGENDAVGETFLGGIPEDKRSEVFGPAAGPLGASPLLNLVLWQKLGYDRHSA